MANRIIRGQKHADEWSTGENNHACWIIPAVLLQRGLVKQKERCRNNWRMDVRIRGLAKWSENFTNETNSMKWGWWERSCVTWHRIVLFSDDTALLGRSASCWSIDLTESQNLGDSWLFTSLLHSTGWIITTAPTSGIFARQVVFIEWTRLLQSNVQWIALMRYGFPARPLQNALCRIRKVRSGTIFCVRRLATWEKWLGRLSSSSILRKHTLIRLPHSGNKKFPL